MRPSIRPLLIAGAAALAIFGLAAGAAAAVFNPETFTLANGMQVIVIPNNRVPVVTHMVWYKAGSADEEIGKSGTAHLLEHLMFKGTKTIPSGEFSKIVARNGGRDNAFTSVDYTGYHQSVAVDRLEVFMKMEADRMTNLVLKQSEIDTERDVVLEERRSRTDTSPAARLGEQMSAALFINHPYRKPIIGWEHEIKSLTLADLERFYKRWYSPANAVLVVSGDITAEKLRPLAEKYYGVIPAAAPTPRRRNQEPPHNAARTLTLKDARVRQPSWRRAYLAPSHGYGDNSQTYALEVLAEIFGGGTTSTLYRTLVVENKVAVSVGAFYDPDRRGPARFSLFASPRPGVSLDKVAAEMEAQIAKLLAAGVGSAEVARATTRMQAQAIFARDSLGAGARVLGAAIATGQSVEDVESWPERIAAVTAAQINEAAKAVLIERQSVTGLLLPEDEK